MTKFAHALATLVSHWMMKYCYLNNIIRSLYPPSQATYEKIHRYLDCVCGIKLFPNSSVSQTQTQGDHPSFLLWPLCHMTVTWLILSSHMMPIVQLSLRISYRVTQLSLSQTARCWSLPPQCPTLPSEPSDGPHLLLPLWTRYTSIIVLSLNSEEWRKIFSCTHWWVNSGYIHELLYGARQWVEIWLWLYSCPDFHPSFGTNMQLQNLVVL